MQSQSAYLGLNFDLWTFGLLDFDLTIDSGEIIRGSFSLWDILFTLSYKCAASMLERVAESFKTAELL